jgi:hypothetical protein
LPLAAHRQSLAALVNDYSIVCTDNGHAEKVRIFQPIHGQSNQDLPQNGNLRVPRTWRNRHAEPTPVPPKVAVLTVVQVNDALSAHWTFELSDQLSVRK